MLDFILGLLFGYWLYYFLVLTCRGVDHLLHAGVFAYDLTIEHFRADPDRDYAPIEAWWVLFSRAVWARNVYRARVKGSDRWIYWPGRQPKYDQEYKDDPGC